MYSREVEVLILRIHEEEMQKIAFPPDHELFALIDAAIVGKEQDWTTKIGPEDKIFGPPRKAGLVTSRNTLK